MNLNTNMMQQATASVLLQVSTTKMSVKPNMIEEVTGLLMGVQTELILFALAIATHLLFFNKLGMGKSKKAVNLPTKPQQKGQSGQRASLVALKAALKAADIKAAMTHFEELHGLFEQGGSPSSAPHMLLESIVKLAATKEVLPELLRLINKMGLLATALDLVLAAAAQPGAERAADAATLKHAEELARAQGVKFTAATYQALIKGASTCGNAKQAQQIMVEAQSKGVADVHTFCIYIKGLLKKGDMQEVRKVMEYMRSAGLKPNTIAFNGLVAAAVAVDAESAWSMVAEMKAFDVKPDNVTCSILLKSIIAKSATSALGKVVALIDQTEGDMDEVLVNSLVEASVRVGRADVLVPFLKKQRSTKRLTIKGSHTYASIIRAHGYVQDLQGAWDTWHEMSKQNIAPISVTLGCMVEALCSNGDVEGGYQIIHEAAQNEKTASLVNAIMYGSIVKGFSHKKCFDRVWEVYAEMVALKLKFSMVTFNTLIDACSRSGDLSRIPALLKDIDDQGLKIGLISYSAILKGYCQTNRLEEAFELIEDMTKNTSHEPDEIMFNTLLDGCARQALYDRGMALFEKMKKAGVRPSNFTLSVLVKLCNRGKKLEKAFEICEELSAKHRFRLNVHVFDNLIQACIQHHDLPRAFGVLERMLQERVRPDVRTFLLLLRACIEARQPAEAAGLLRGATGLRGAHPRLAQYAAASVQPQGGLPGDLVSEILWGLIGDERLAAGLVVELGRLPGMKLDPKLRLKLTARMAGL